MNQILPLLITALKNDKGRDVNRTLVLLGVGWCAWQLTVLDKRIAVIEAVHAPQIHQHANGFTATNHLARVTP